MLKTEITFESRSSWNIYERYIFGNKKGRGDGSASAMNSVKVEITGYGEGPKFFDISGKSKIYEVWADVRYSIRCWGQGEGGLAEENGSTEEPHELSHSSRFNEFFTASSPSDYKIGVIRTREVIKKKIISFLLSEVQRLCGVSRSSGGER